MSLAVQRRTPQPAPARGRRLCARRSLPAASSPGGPTARFAVSLQFRTPAPKNTNEVWDLDNLIKPTLDAMEEIFGLRPWSGLPQPADDRVDYLTASKRTVAADGVAGAVITIHVLAD